MRRNRRMCNKVNTRVELVLLHNRATRYPKRLSQQLDKSRFTRAIDRATKIQLFETNERLIYMYSKRNFADIISLCQMI